ncbi:hypothetical protein [Flavobacterium sp. ACAM 123]|uniref:hypothetical protein n=1 Tax=Flavobacterium sp. ACAM 123 TaxID=1189620 RepID=UPI0003159883|nr:hypothetical protein [Flavobacterium sp. ACAM 123]
MERVFAITKSTISENYLLLGINNGNGGSAIFRYYINTDGNAATGLKSETYKSTAYPIAGAEIVLELDASKNALTVFKYTAAGAIDPNFTSLGVLSAIGSYVPGDNSFIEVKIPISAATFDVCNSTTNGVITLAKYLSFSGGSINSAPCALKDIDFIIALNGIVSPDKTYCYGQDTKTTLTLSGQLGNVVRWESSTDILFPLATTTSISNITASYDTPANLTTTTYFRAVINSILCQNITLKSQPATITINPATPAPSVTASVVYCLNATASQLTATGTNLLWYTVATNGTGNTTAPTPLTTTAGSTTYYVSQTITANGISCVGPRSPIVVT